MQSTQGLGCAGVEESMNTPSARRRILPSALAVVVASALLSLSATVFAQGAKPAPAAPAATTTTTTTGDYSENRTDGSAVVVFKEDAVGAGGAGAFGGTILRPPGATRVGLLRPRFNFVSEMLKSVETL